jgi:hypothetical protein
MAAWKPRSRAGVSGSGRAGIWIESGADVDAAASSFDDAVGAADEQPVRRKTRLSRASHWAERIITRPELRDRGRM